VPQYQHLICIGELAVSNEASMLYYDFFKQMDFLIRLDDFHVNKIFGWLNNNKSAANF